MLIRIGEKIINLQKIHKAIDDALEMRSRGLSQHEAATRVGLERTVISRLETLGEVRKGGRVAILGFPVANGDEIVDMATQEGVEYCLVLSERQRWDFVEQKSGVELFNDIMEVIATLRRHDIVIVLGSNMRIKLVETLLGRDVIGVMIGESPIAEDKYVNIEDIQSIIRQIKI